jgi:hypothetical protein
MEEPGPKCGYNTKRATFAGFWQLADISSSFVVVGSKRENMIRRWTFGSKLLGRVRADSDAQKSSR